MMGEPTSCEQSRAIERFPERTESRHDVDRPPKYERVF